MTFLELRHSLIQLINKSEMTPEEIYGVIASIEAEVRYGLIRTIPKEVKE